MKIKLSELITLVKEGVQETKPRKLSPSQLKSLIESVVAEIKHEADEEVEEAKKYKGNPYAICGKNIDRKKEPEKYERCVQDVKKKTDWKN